MRIEELKEKLSKQKEQLALIEQQRVFLMGTIAILEDLIKHGASSKRITAAIKAEASEEGPQPTSNNSSRV